MSLASLAVSALVQSIISGFVAAAMLYVMHSRFRMSFFTLVALTLLTPAFLIAATSRIEHLPIVGVRAAIAHQTLVTSAPSRVGRARLDSLTRQTASAPRADAAAILALVWLGGFLVALGRVGLGIARLRQIAKRADEVDVRTTSRGAVSIRVSDHFAVPVALGYRSPSIILPRAMLALNHDCDLEHVLLHEVQHLEHYDDLSILLQALCMSALWFNPFAYYVASRIGVEREMACDEAVVTRTGAPALYAATLLKLADEGVDAPSMAFASTFSSRAHIVARLENLLRLGRKPRGTVRRLTSLAAALLPLGLAGAAVAPVMTFAPARIADYSVVQLHSHEILLVGGRRADGSAAGAAQLYDASGRLLATIAMPIARWGATITPLANGDALIIGGMTPGGATGDAERFDARTRTFETAGALQTPRAYHSATQLPGGEIVVAGGERAAGQYVSQTEIYNPRRGRFTYGPDGPSRVSPMVRVIERGDVLIFGGYTPPGHPDCAVIFSAARHAFREAGTLIHVSAHELTFKLPSGHLVTHLT